MGAVCGWGGCLDEGKSSKTCIDGLVDTTRAIYDLELVVKGKIADTQSGMEITRRNPRICTCEREYYPVLVDEIQLTPGIW